jgi:hypothetical protein
MVALDSTDARKDARTFIVTTVTEPSAVDLRVVVYVTVTFDAPVASWAAAATSRCMAARMASLLAFAGSENVRNKDTGAVIVSVKLKRMDVAAGEGEIPGPTGGRVDDGLADDIFAAGGLEGDSVSALVSVTLDSAEEEALLALADRAPRPEGEGRPEAEPPVAIAVSTTLERDGVDEAAGVFEPLGVNDGDAPMDNVAEGDGVAVAESVGEAESDGVGVGSAVAVPLALGVELGVSVPDGVCDAVRLDDGEGVAGALALLLGLAPLESDAVGEPVELAL